MTSKVYSILRRPVTPATISFPQQVADVAFDFWLERCFRNGSPEEDLLKAVLALTFRAGYGDMSPKLYLVPKRASGKILSIR
ncbi:MAG TPA: hypothetical protein VGH38_25605 [Bryobacteraceae bacterium]|jgi:hypothetical protein